jgi:hypothetical protein
MLNFLTGYFEGRALADIDELKKIEQQRMQMEFDALPEDAKQRVREAAAARARAQAPAGPIGTIVILVIFAIIVLAFLA